ncbi:DUF3500 domain-containing protein [Maribellus comscasis]|uniref:DUF3500 domain-containing protein n=1 Tax=Maribellus comscasis TaxID=2681766 RepID=A0A6I6JMB6_9BACT|nr:DUF3500 domain-containing protein [Maribellus comscasis]QGY42188.1 DUF3500 domain-containing protein [Maribellus comscasis]
MKTKFILFIILFILMSAFETNCSEPALSFLNSLTGEQKDKLLHAFNDDSKSEWHYFPATMFPRAGISLGELNRDQKQLFFEFLHSSLSETGYSKTKQIISLEDVLAEISGNSHTRDPEKYYIAFYGNPEKDSLWSWCIQGHHLSLNFAVINGKTEIAPRFMGANPATVKSGKRKGTRTLFLEEDLGLQLINSIQEKQKAIFSEHPPYDIVTRNDAEVDPLNPVGIKLKELKRTNQELLLNLINEYLAILPEELAEKRMQKIQSEELGEIRFGWAGGTQAGKPHYYRVQGKTFLIEFDNTQNNANHIHSVWRDFDGDFGRNLIREHYQHSHHH